jgi:hypothetical protein
MIAALLVEERQLRASTRGDLEDSQALL